MLLTRLLCAQTSRALRVQQAWPPSTRRGGNFMTQARRSAEVLGTRHQKEALSLFCLYHLLFCCNCLLQLARKRERLRKDRRIEGDGCNASYKSLRCSQARHQAGLNLCQSLDQLGNGESGCRTGQVMECVSRSCGAAWHGARRQL